MRFLLLTIACLTFGVTTCRAESTDFRHCAGTYAAAPRKADKRVDIPALLTRLKDLHAESYNWLIWREATDWDDLQLFLPRAKEQGLRVWVTVVPPTESPPRTRHYAEPFRTDYDRWAVELAKLSLKQPNLVAWSIDDFSENLAFFTPKKTAAMLRAARAINPKLAFVPCCYFKQVTPKVARDYAPLFDGVLCPYRNESRKMNLKDADAVTSEVARLRELLGPKVAVVIDVYSTGHSQLGQSTPQYVREVMTDALKSADGVMVYCTPDPKGQPEKFAIVKDLFAARGSRH